MTTDAHAAAVQATMKFIASLALPAEKHAIWCRTQADADGKQIAQKFEIACALAPGVTRKLPTEFDGVPVCRVRWEGV